MVTRIRPGARAQIMRPCARASGFRRASGCGAAPPAAQSCGVVAVEAVFIGLAGLIVGSFLNVCIVRMPEEQSVVTPSSHCPRCKTPIRWFDNIPVVSWLVLRGKCRSCALAISARYPLVESLNALAWLALWRVGLEPREFALYAVLASLLIVITFIDLDYRIIPDKITWPSILIAPAAALVVGHMTVTESIIGILAGGGVLWGIAELYLRVRKQEGMGLGDVKMLAMVGGLLGWEAAFFTLVVGSLIGTVFGLSAMLVRRGRLDMEIPFGPFLAAGCMLYMLGGPAFLGWYFSRTAML
jgi:leader peptidase (prepilin peptidase)/N-methyltransferase